MDKKRMLKLKKKLLKNYKKNMIDNDSKRLLNKLGFSVKYDSENNMYLYDNIHNERMYTNTLFIKGVKYKSSESKYYSLGFSVNKKHINNISLYKK